MTPSLRPHSLRRRGSRTVPALGMVTLAAGALSGAACTSAGGPAAEQEQVIVSTRLSSGTPPTGLHAVDTRAIDGRATTNTSGLTGSAVGGQARIVNGSSVSYDDAMITRVTRLTPRRYLRSAGGPVTVIAHRGASAAAPENTLVAQEIARRAGADLVENDVQPSKDGVPFVLHDPTVDRTTDGSGAIRTLTSTRLKKLDAGSWFAPHFAGARLPTLAAQLADLRTRGGGDLLLEIKGTHTKAQVAKIIKVIRAERMTGRVFVQSFDVSSLKYTYALAPELPLGLLRSTLDADPVAVSKELHLTAYNPSHGALLARRGVVADLHGAGVAVMAWTADSAATWKALDAAGVDAIITNRPAELAGWNAALGSRRS